MARSILIVDDNAFIRKALCEMFKREELLQMAGTDKSKLLVAHVWLADMTDFDDHNAVWNDWVDRQNPPVRVCVGAPLWHAGVRVEIMVSAAK